jgi:hypothetical protein
MFSWTGNSVAAIRIVFAEIRTNFFLLRRYKSLDDP